jgi:hypothetical protein
MANQSLLFIRPADDSASICAAGWGQAVRLLATSFSSVDLSGAQVKRSEVETQLPLSSALFYFGHGEQGELVANGKPLLDSKNLHLLQDGPIIAIACYAAVDLGRVAGTTHPNITAFLGFDDELVIPLQYPLPMGMAVVNGLRCLLTDDHQIACAANQLREAFDEARRDYKFSGSSYGLSLSDARIAWLAAKSNRHSVQVHGDTSATL